MIKAYLAGKYEDKERLIGIANKLLYYHFEIVSNWLWVPEEHQPTREHQFGYALRDLDDLSRASMFFLDTLSENNRGGREVELGYALGRGLTCFIVGPIRNIFHNVPRQFNSWEICFKELGYMGFN